MMLFFLSHFRHRSYEINRIGEIIELERPLDVFLLEFPLRNLFQALLQLACFHQISHTVEMSNTPKLFCNAESRAFFASATKGRFQAIWRAIRARPSRIPKHVAPAWRVHASVVSA